MKMLLLSRYSQSDCPSCNVQASGIAKCETSDPTSLVACSQCITAVPDMAASYCYGVNYTSPDYPAFMTDLAMVTTTHQVTAGGSTRFWQCGLCDETCQAHQQPVKPSMNPEFEVHVSP